MSTAAPLSLIVPLPHPARGGASRLRLGSAEIVLEHARGAHTLLWSDGRNARRYVLGLGDHDSLTIELKAPRLPVQVIVREAITVVPNARLHGYVVVPLIPTVVCRGSAGRAQTLIELRSPDLTALWDEAIGHVHRCASGWMSRFPFQTGEPRVVVPLRIAHDGDRPVSPAHLLLRLGDDDLVSLRGSVVVRPQRLQWRGDAFVMERATKQTMEQRA
jgi:hypothetical protein